MNNMFPRTNVGGISVSRMIIGTNWILGYSHTSPAADKLIKRHNGTKKAIADLIEVFVNAGVNMSWDFLMVILYWLKELMKLKIVQEKIDNN